MLSILFSLLLAQASGIPREPPEGREGAGFLFRVDAGGGYSNYKNPPGSPSSPEGISFYGATVAAGIHFAYSPGQPFAVGLHLFDDFQPLAGSNLGTFHNMKETNLIGGGPEIIFGSGGWSFSLTPAFVRLDIGIPEFVNHDYEGVSLLGRLGREWPISPHARAGFQAQVQYGRLGSGDDVYHFFTATVGGSVTFGLGLL
jgi:hypothetical protein